MRFCVGVASLDSNGLLSQAIAKKYGPVTHQETASIAHVAMWHP